MRVVSWNVNGIRAAWGKGLPAYLAAAQADVVGLQEVRALPEQIPAGLREDSTWHAAYHPAERKGYSGVALLSRVPPDRVETSLGEDRFDSEGRVQVAHFGRLAIFNVYFPNGSGPGRDHSRIPYKLAFYEAVRARAEALRRSGRRVLVMGDWNTAHRPIDLARPKTNAKTSGFTPTEREAFDVWLQAGWVDTFRRQHGDVPDHYTWWSQRMGVRERNVGWRIDYVLASTAAARFVRDAFHRPKVLGSDHCPVGVDLDPAITGT